MKRFQIIYYVILGLIILLTFYLASDLGGFIDSMRSWGWFRFYTELIPIASKVLYTVGVILVITVGIENFLRFKKRKHTKDLENEILALKARLYDRAEEEKAQVAQSEMTDQTQDHLLDQDIDAATDENVTESE